MTDFSRHTDSPEERAELKRIEESLKTSSYLGDVWESIHTGIRAKPSVPNYKQPTRGEVMASTANETGGLHMDFEGLYDGASLPELSEQSAGQSQSPMTKTASSGPRLVLSKNQAMAVQKYPTLVEFLGQPDGEKIAKQLMSDVNAKIADVIASNSRECNQYALMCTADKHNMKQYFKGDDWLCRVTVAGTFRGDEAIYYSKDKDAACVLRKSKSRETTKYADVSDQFDITFDYEVIPADTSKEVTSQ